MKEVIRISTEPLAPHGDPAREALPSPMVLSIQDPFGDCEEDGHHEHWTKYPHGADGKTADGRELGTVTCLSCDTLIAFGMPEPARRRG